jgi:hypothetical protein
MEISSARCRQRYSRVGIVLVGRNADLRPWSQHRDVASYHDFTFVIPLATFGRSYFFARVIQSNQIAIAYTEALANH